MLKNPVSGITYGKGRVYGPQRPAAQVNFARDLYRLLQRPARGKPQDGNGYKGHIRIASYDFEDHLYGGVILAVACVSEGSANFLAFDCDEGFPKRLAIYEKVLSGRGLATAAFVTTGSTAGRGKIAVTLKHRIPQSFAMKLAEEIETEVVSDESFGAIRPAALTCFPSAGDGSYCRILGRKYAPAPFEVFGNLQGKRTSDLSFVVPASIEVPTLSHAGVNVG